MIMIMCLNNESCDNLAGTEDKLARSFILLISSSVTFPVGGTNTANPCLASSCATRCMQRVEMNWRE